MIKHKLHKEMKDVKKHLPVNDDYLQELHKNLSDLHLLKGTRSNNHIHGSIKSTVSIACCLAVFLFGIFVIPKLVVEGNKSPVDPGITDSPITGNESPVVDENAQHEVESLLVVCADNKFGFMNLSGKVVIEPQFDYASEFNEYGVATVMNYENGQENYGLIGVDGLLTDINLWDIGSFHEGIAKAKSKGGKYGFINAAGEWIVQPVYDDVKDFSEGLAAVGLVSNEGNEVVSEPDRWGFVDKSGNVVIEPQYQEVKSFSNGLAFVQEHGSWKTTDIHYVDTTGNRVITLPWELILDASSFADDGTAVIQKVSKDDMSVSISGVIDRRGELVLPFDFSYVSNAVDGLRVASPSNKSGTSYSGVIDEKGNWVVEPKYFDLSKINNGLFAASVIKDGRQHTGILKVEGTWLYEPEHYGVFSFKNNMVVFIEDTGYNGVGVVMSLYDLDGNQLLDGQKFNTIQILSKDYIRCGTVIDNGKGIVAWSIYNPDGTELMPGTNMRTARLLPDRNILATVLKEDEFYTGLADPKTKAWIIEPRYYNVIKYLDGVGVGIRKVKEKSTDDTIVFVMEIFDSQGNIRYTSNEEAMPLDSFQMNWFTVD